MVSADGVMVRDALKPLQLDAKASHLALQKGWGRRLACNTFAFTPLAVPQPSGGERLIQGLTRHLAGGCDEARNSAALQRPILGSSGSKRPARPVLKLAPGLGHTATTPIAFARPETMEVSASRGKGTWNFVHPSLYSVLFACRYHPERKVPSGTAQQNLAHYMYRRRDDGRARHCF